MKVLIGAGGLATDFLTYLKSAYCVDIVDDFKTGDLLGHPIIGTMEHFIKGTLKDRYWKEQAETYICIGSCGDNSARNRVFSKLKKAGIDVKNVVMSSFISKDVVFGENVLANIGSQIHHGCTVSDNVVISPGVIICGDCGIHDNVFIGAGSTIIQGIQIGENSIIAAGATVTRNIPPNEIWGGVPSRFIKSHER